MPNYEVMLAIDVDADDPEEAAKKAYDDMCDLIYPNMEVVEQRDGYETIYVVDLGAREGTQTTVLSREPMHRG